MRLQTLTISEFSRDLAQRLRALLAHFNEAAALLKIVHTQRAGEARGTAGRQHVVRAPITL